MLGRATHRGCWPYRSAGRCCSGRWRAGSGVSAAKGWCRMAGSIEPRTKNRELRMEDRRSKIEERDNRSSIFDPRSSIRRLLRLWKLYAIMDFTFVAADIRLALVYFVSDFILHFAGITATLLLAQRFAGIGAWSRDQILFMLGYASTVTGLLSLFFGYNVLMISRRVGRGQ